MKPSYLILALWSLSCATLRHEGRDNMAAINYRHIRSVFYLIPQANNQEDGKPKRQKLLKEWETKKICVKRQYVQEINHQNHEKEN